MNNETEQIFIVNTSESQPSTAVSKLNEASGSTSDNIEDFSTVCRTCATVTEFVIPIFEGEGIQNNLAEKIQKHLPIEVSEQDVLPRVVCYQCASTLLAWHELVQCCVSADAALRARLASRQVANVETKENPKEKIPTSTEEQQNKWKTCRIKFEPCDYEDETSDLDQYVESKYTKEEDNVDGGESADEDDEPLSNLARKKTADLYDNFYKALVNFKNHFLKEHASDDISSESTDSSESETLENEAEKDENDVDRYDDLSHCNMRKDRMNAEMRLELNRVQTKINGKIFYTCPVCGKNLSSPHTYVFHKRIHTGERPCVCHVCGKQFRAPNGLQRHLTETHERARRHACRLCHKSFANSQNLKQHLRIHTGEKPYECSDCGKRFAQSGSLHVHAKTHSGLLPHECAECGAKFRLRAGLTRHTLRHSGVRAHACSVCGRTFRLRHELTAHARAHSAPLPPVVCSLCGAAFRQRSALRHHTRRVHGLDALPRETVQPLLPTYPRVGTFKDIEEFVVRSLDPPEYVPPAVKACVYCLAEVPQQFYKEHLVALHSDFLFHCDECDTYVDRKEFLLHMSLHAVEYAAKQEKKEQESKAKKVTKKKDGKDENENNEKGARKCYKRASRSVKTTDKPQNQAKKTTNSGDAPENEFSDHSDAQDGFGPLPESVFEAIEDSQESQPPDTTSPVEREETESRTTNRSDEPEAAPPPAKSSTEKKVKTCQICGKEYTAPSSYFYHMKHFHGRSRDHECPTCGKKFGTKAALAQHEPIHTGKCAYGCERCGKRFRSKASLYIHSQTHESVKRWVCSECGRAFRWRAALARHSARHRSERSHKCSHCPRAFSVRADLLRHARTHAPSRHACPNCPLYFAQLRYLKVHMDRKHPATNSKVPDKTVS